MREILFKAKEKETGKWVEGMLFDGYHNCFIINSMKQQDYPSGECKGYGSMVNKDTVCQYTGLTDKNGKKIWENDIIHSGDRLIPYIVEWHDTGFMGKAVNAMDRIGLKYWSPKIEVIGNIFDNPELLEVKDVN